MTSRGHKLRMVFAWAMSWALALVVPVFALAVSGSAQGFAIAETGGDTTVAESGTQDTFDVVLTTQPAADVLIVVAYSDGGEAVAWHNTPPSSLTFGPSNWDVPQTVYVDGVNDDIDDGDQTSTVTLSIDDANSDDAFDPLPDQYVTVTTTDDDTAGFIVTHTGGDTTVTEAGGSDTFEVVLTSQPEGDVRIEITVGDTSEVRMVWADCDCANNCITFTQANWDTPCYVTVEPEDDDVDDGDQTTYITFSIVDAFSDLAYDPLPDQDVPVTTIDDDTAGFIVTHTGGDTIVTEAGGVDHFEVVLTSQPEDNVRIEITVGDTSEVRMVWADCDCANNCITFTQANWDTPCSVAVEPEDDDVDDGDQTTYITFSIVDEFSDLTYDPLPDQNVQVTTIDDDFGVTINQAGGQSDPTKPSPVVFTAVFDEPISDATFTNADVNVGGTATTGTVTVTEVAPNDGTTFEVSIVATSDGTVVPVIPAGGVEDTAGNTNGASTSMDNSVTVDATEPDVTISQSGGQADPTGVSPILFTVVFDEPINEGTFSDLDVNVGGTAAIGSVSVTEVAPYDDTTFILSIAINADGTVIPAIPAGGVEDSVGNTNTASTSTDNSVTYDSTKPDVTINQEGGQADPTSTSPVVFTVVFDEPIIDTTFTNGAVTVGGTATTGTVSVTEVAPNNDTAFEVSIVVAGDGTVVPTIPAGGVEDSAGNMNNPSTSTDNVVVYDTSPPTGPTVSSSSHTTDEWDNNQFVVINVSGASDAGSGVDGFEVEWDTNPTWTPTETKEWEKTYSGETFTVWMSGDYYFHIAAVDAAGNWTGATHLGPFRIDINNPSVPDMLSPSLNAYTSDTSPTLSWAPSTDSGGSGLRAADTYRVVVEGTPSRDYYTANTSYTPTLAEGVFVWKVRARDNAGNWSNYTADHTLTIDTVSPNVTVEQASSQGDPTNTSPVVFTATFDEPVNLLTMSLAQIAISGTAATGDVTLEEIAPYDGTTFSITVDVTSDGTVTASIPAGEVEDYARNSNTASTSLDNTVTYDSLAPAAPSTPDMTAETDSGSSDGDNLTNDTTPTFTGTGEPGGTATLGSLSADFTHGTVDTGPIDGSGNWTITSSLLLEGDYLTVAYVTDAAGNMSEASSTLFIRIDVTPPDTPHSFDLADASDTGKSNSDEITNDSTPTIYGNAEPGALVQLYVNGTPTGAPAMAAGGMGVWSVTAEPCSDGPSEFTADATDPAGNVSTRSPAFNIAIDTAAPVCSQPTLRAVDDTGQYDNDHVTQGVSPQFDVTADDADSGIWKAEISSTEPLQKKVAYVDDGFYTAELLSSLDEGVRTVTATVYDVAGNSSSCDRSILVDRTPPSCSAPDLASESDTGLSSTDDITQGISPRFLGTATDAGSGVWKVDVASYSLGFVQIETDFSGGGSVTAPYDVTLGDIDEGSQAVGAMACDVAGNCMAQYEAAWLAVDRTAPEATSIVANTDPICDADLTQLVTVGFDETMDTSVKPTVEVTGITTEKSDSTNGNWIHDQQYAVAVTLDDDDEEDAVLDIVVSGAVDVAGNMQASQTEANPFTIDTLNPRVSKVTPYDTLVTDQDVFLTNQQQIHVQFSEFMDQTINPVLTFAPDVTAAPATLVFVRGEWPLDYYQADYSLVDVNVNIRDVFVGVSGARDLAGNLMIDYTAESEFGVDTRDPQATVTVSHDTVADGNPIYEGALVLTVTVSYDEPMDTNDDPAISIEGGSNWGAQSGIGWSGDTVYTATFTHNGTQEEIADAFARVPDASGAHDAPAGNDDLGDDSPFFDIDTKKPMATITLSHTLIADANVGETFAATLDYDEAMNTGIAPIVVYDPGLGTTLDPETAAWTDADTYVLTYTILDGGVTVNNDDVQVSGARDVAGNLQNPANRNDLMIDTENPVISGATVIGGSVDDSCNRVVTFSATVTDPNGTMNSGDITITSATETTGRAQYSAVYDVVRADPSQATATISGKVDVHDLTSCPAIARVVFDAVDHVGNVAVQAFDTDTVEDTSAPVIDPLLVDDDVAVTVDCCVTPVPVAFSATVTDNCCLYASNVFVTVELAESNATLEYTPATDLVITQVDDRTVTVSGSAIVRCLIGCPARVVVTVDATDCCGNSQTRESTDTEGRVYDRTAPEPLPDPYGYDDPGVRTLGRRDSDQLEVRFDDAAPSNESPYRLVVREDTSVRIDVLANDDDNCTRRWETSPCQCCGTLWIHDITTPPEFGAVTIVDDDNRDCSESSSIRYLPNTGYIGRDKFSYQPVDACGNLGPETWVYLEVVSAVLAEDVSVTTCQDGAVEIDVLASDVYINALSPEEIEFSFSIYDGFDHGVLIGSLASVSYEPASTEEDPDTGEEVTSFDTAECATLCLQYIPAAGYAGRDGLEVAFGDPWGMSETIGVEVWVSESCAQAGTAFRATRGEIVTILLPEGYAAIHDTPEGACSLICGATVSGIGEHGHVSWNSPGNHYVLVLNTEGMPEGGSRLLIPIGNEEYVDLRFEVGEVR